MKKELLASVLTLTAGMASTITYPQTALARSTIVEKQFSKKFLLKTKNPARWTQADGSVEMGYIYLELEQTPFTPEYQNKLHGEMVGRIYFSSSHVNFDLAGDEGGVLLDLTDKNKDRGSTYQIYGCNSTRTQCIHDEYELSINGKNKITMNFNLAHFNIEILETFDHHQQWSSIASLVPMVEVESR